MAENHDNQINCHFKNIEDILVFLHPYGTFQRIVNVILGIAYIGGVYHAVSACFTNIDPPWRCKSNSSVCNYSTEHLISDHKVCQIPRSEWEYTQPIGNSIISQFDLICDQEWLAHMSTSVFYFAWGIGAIIIGKLSDYYGRKIMVIPLIFIQVIVTLVASFSPSIYVFIACRIALGILTSAAEPVLLILMGELVDSRNRPFASSVLCNICSAGIILYGVTAYFIREWKILLLVYGIPYIILLPFYKFIPESVHWLHLHDRKKELKTVLEKIANWNKVKIPEDITASLSKPLHLSEKCSFLDLFRPIKLAMRTIITAYGWFAAVMIYFGVSLAVEDLGGSLYLNFVLMNVVEIPSNVISSFTNRKFGRKITVTTSFLIGSAACLSVSFIPNHGKAVIGRIVAGLIGKACSTIIYNSLNTWSIEIYPTNMRGYAVGFFTFVGRIGGAVSPWIVKGLRSVDVKAPFITMGTLGVFASFILVFLPETKGVPIKAVNGDENNDNLEIPHEE